MPEGRNLPWSTRSSDEFLDPSTDRWRYTFASAAYDSWILWRDAIGRNHASWVLLDRKAALKIKRLAEKLHAIHLEIGGEELLGESPWVFRSWWRPGSDGGSCEFWMRGVTTDAFLRAAERVSAKTQLKVIPIGEPWLQASLKGCSPAWRTQP